MCGLNLSIVSARFKCTQRNDLTFSSMLFDKKRIDTSWRRVKIGSFELLPTTIIDDQSSSVDFYVICFVLAEVHVKLYNKLYCDGRLWKSSNVDNVLGMYFIWNIKLLIRCLTSKKKLKFIIQNSRIERFQWSRNIFFPFEKPLFYFFVTFRYFFSIFFSNELFWVSTWKLSEIFCNCLKPETGYSFWKFIQNWIWMRYVSIKSLESRPLFISSIYSGNTRHFLNQSNGFNNFFETYNEISNFIWINRLLVCSLLTTCFCFLVRWSLPKGLTDWLYSV